MAKTAAALHILVKEEKLALDLLEQLKNGADFGKLAKKHSICPSGKRGGDLGEFRQGQMVPAFDKVVFSCPEQIHASMDFGLPEGGKEVHPQEQRLLCDWGVRTVANASASRKTTRN